MKYTLTYTRTFTHEFECANDQEADRRVKQWKTAFPADEVTLLSVYADSYKPPVVQEVKKTKMEELVEGMRASVNRMLPRDPA